MPSTGTPSSSTPRSSWGAPGSYTLEGPPERIDARGLPGRDGRPAEIVPGWISQ